MIKLVSIAFGSAALGATLVAGRHMVQSNGTRTERTSDSSVSASGATRLELKAPIASIVLETGNSSDLSVHAVRWTKTPDSAPGRHWMNDAHLTVMRSGDELSVEDKLDGDSSMKNVKGNFNGGLELHVSVPRGLAVKMEVGVGTAKTNGDYRSVDFSIGAGDFVGRFDLTGRGSSEVHVGAGRVELNIPRGANLDVNTATGVGDVTGLPATQEDTKGLHIGDRRAARFGNGGASLSVHVGAGAIVINSSSNPKALPSESADTDIDQGAREQSLWSGDVDSNMSMDLDPDKTLAVIGPTVDRAIALSNAEVDQAMKQCKPEMDQDLANVGPEVARALKEVQPEIDRALAEVGPDVDRALKQNRPEIDRELAKIGPEIAKAMKEMRPQIEQARKEQMRELQKMRPEIEQAMKEAEKAIDEAARELGKEGGDHSTLEKSVRKAILDALKSAREAMKEAKSAAQKAVQDAKKHSADDEDN